MAYRDMIPGHMYRNKANGALGYRAENSFHWLVTVRAMDDGNKIFVPRQDPRPIDLHQGHDILLFDDLGSMVDIAEELSKT